MMMMRASADIADLPAELEHPENAGGQNFSSFTANGHFAGRRSAARGIDFNHAGASTFRRISRQQRGRQRASWMNDSPSPIPAAASSTGIGIIKLLTGT